MSATYEPVVECTDGIWYLTLTIATAYDSTWTSRPAPLTAKNRADALTEARGQVLALRRVLEGV